MCADRFLEFWNTVFLVLRRLPACQPQTPALQPIGERIPDVARWFRLARCKRLTKNFGLANGSQESSCAPYIGRCDDCELLIFFKVLPSVLPDEDSVRLLEILIAFECCSHAPRLIRFEVTRYKSVWNARNSSSSLALHRLTF